MIVEAPRFVRSVPLAAPFAVLVSLGAVAWAGTGAPDVAEGGGECGVEAPAILLAQELGAPLEAPPGPDRRSALEASEFLPVFSFREQDKRPRPHARDAAARASLGPIAPTGPTRGPVPRIHPRGCLRDWGLRLGGEDPDSPEA